ncbi:MAG: hypothetical protein ABSF28_12380 [Terracidiphilus sp.]
MRSHRFFATLGLAVALVAGCHSNTNMVDKSAFKTALDNYLVGQDVCLFGVPVKLPAQADTDNDEQTKGFDALTDAALLTRTPEEKKRFLIGSKQVNDYDLSSKGRTVWTAEPTQPGYGNFCFGSPKVVSVDNYTALSSTGNTYSVSYQYAVNLPDWAKTEEMKTAFPSIGLWSAPRTATANLAKGDTGWSVQHVAASSPAQP